MIVETSKTSEKRFELYTGVVALPVTALNPTLEELQTIIPNASRTLEYSKEDTHSLVIYFSGVVNTNHVIRLENKIRVSRDGEKTQFIDDYGEIHWGTRASAIEKLDPETLREARNGEDALYMFLRAWQNVFNTKNKKLKLTLSDKDAPFRGDFSEIKQAFNERGTTDKGDIRKVRVLLGVETKETESGTKRYQRIYSYHMEPSWMTSERQFEYQVSRTPFSSDYQDSFEFRKYEETPVTQVSNNQTNQASDGLPF